MDEIGKCMQLLIHAIKDSSEYHVYKQAEASLGKDPQLMQRVDEFNLANFRLHAWQDSQQSLEGLAELNQESQALRKIPQVNAYLQAELDLCKLLQYVSLEINGKLDIHVPPGIETVLE